MTSSHLSGPRPRKPAYMPGNPSIPISMTSHNVMTSTTTTSRLGSAGKVRPSPTTKPSSSSVTTSTRTVAMDRGASIKTDIKQPSVGSEIPHSKSETSVTASIKSKVSATTSTTTTTTTIQRSPSESGEEEGTDDDMTGLQVVNLRAYTQLPSFLQGTRNPDVHLTHTTLPSPSESVEALQAKIQDLEALHRRDEKTISLLKDQLDFLQSEVLDSRATADHWQRQYKLLLQSKQQQMDYSTASPAVDTAPMVVREPTYQHPSTSDQGAIHLIIHEPVITSEPEFLSLPAPSPTTTTTAKPTPKSQVPSSYVTSRKVGGNPTKLDRMVEELVTGMTGLPQNFRRVEGSDRFQFGSKRVLLVVVGEEVMASVGGGFMKFQEYVSRFGVEEEKRWQQQQQQQQLQQSQQR